MADNQTHGDARVLGLIPARGGSKGLPGKNLLDACGRPLIGWSVKSALDSRTITRTVTTTDSPEIAAVAAQHGSDVPFMRPAELATDEAGMMETVFHALDQLPGFDYVMLLQPTSPLRTAEDIDTAFQLLRDSGASSCVSVTRTTENPFLTFTVEGAAGHMRQVVQPLKTIVRRQDFPTTYKLNGAIYVAKVAWLREQSSFVADDTVAYVMPKHRSIDVDTERDFRECCDRLLQRVQP